MAVRKRDSMSRLARSKTEIVEEELEETFISSLLTEEERREIEDDIIAEIEAERRKAAKEEFKKHARGKLRRQAALDEPHETVLIDLPGHSDKIVLDGVAFYHGHVYERPVSVVATLLDVMGKAWMHEENVGGANSNVYTKPRSTLVNGSTQAVTNAPVNQTPAISPMSAGRLTPKINTSHSMRNS
jgi:hypothetical protein